MVDAARVRSGFDAEVMLGERQLTAVLLGLVDAGLIPTRFEFGTPPKVFGLAVPLVIDRTYDPNPDAPPPPVGRGPTPPFEARVLFDHPSGADVQLHVVIDFNGLPLDADLFIGLALETVPNRDGTLADAGLLVTLRDIASPLLDFIEQEYELDKATLLERGRALIDRRVDLGSLAASGRIHRIAWRKLPADDTHAAAIGIFVNLCLRNGPLPENLVPERGNAAEAMNFLPEGADAAMATRPGLYAALAADTFHRFAVVADDGTVSHPWHKSPFNPRSKRLGRIVGVSAAPKIDVQTGLPTNTLRIDVEVEYQVDDFLDPNGHLVLDLTPTVNDRGTLDWKIDADFRASLALEVIGLLTLAALVTGVGALAGLGLMGALAAGMVGGPLLSAIGHELADALYAHRVERRADARMPDVVSGRIELARRRWDPFYTTHHLVGMRPGGARVDASGVALWGTAVLDRHAVPVPHAVITGHRPDSPAPPTNLRWRVRDAEALAADFSALAAGTDRLPFEPPDAAVDPVGVVLTVDQVVERQAAGRLVPRLAMLPMRVDMRHNQVHAILVASRREFTETRNALIDEFAFAEQARIDAADGAAIRAAVDAEFDAAGVVPTGAARDARIQEVLAERAAPAVDAFIDGPLERLAREALQPLLRFDLPPENFAALQRRGVLHLEGLEIIQMRAPGHEGVLYYRDRPDFDARDNLHSLPRYRRTPEGPRLR